MKMRTGSFVSRTALALGFVVILSGTLAIVLANSSNIVPPGEPEALIAYGGEIRDYAFQFPSTWHIYENIHAAFPYVRIENIDFDILQTRDRALKRKDYFKIEIVTLPNKQSLLLPAWVENLVTTSYPLPQVTEKRDMQIAGLPAIYQLEKVGSFVHPVIYTLKGDNVYLINISSADARFKLITQQFLDSFRFNF